jgi:hypothetical protein
MIKEILKSVLAREPKRSWCKDGLGARTVLVQGRFWCRDGLGVGTVLVQGLGAGSWCRVLVQGLGAGSRRRVLAQRPGKIGINLE